MATIPLKDKIEKVSKAESTSKCNTRQNYNKSLKNSSFGVEKFSFSLGLVSKLPEVSPLRNVLPYQLVGVLDGPFLPGGVAVGEINRGLQRLGYPPVPAELHPVVRSYRKDILPVGPQQPGDSLRHLLRILDIRQSLHYKVVPAPLAQGQYRASLPFTKYQVHLPVPEPLSVRLRRTLMYAHPVRDVRGPCRPLAFLVAPVLHPVAAVALQLSALVRTDHLIYPLMRYEHPLLLQPAGYLPRRPLLGPQQSPRFSQDSRTALPVADCPLTPLHGHHVRHRPAVLAEAVAVPFQLPAYRTLVDTYLPSNGCLCLSLLFSQIDCVSLLTGQLSIHSQHKFN